MELLSSLEVGEAFDRLGSLFGTGISVGLVLVMMLGAIDGFVGFGDAKVLVMITGFAGGTMVANQIGVDFVLNLGNNSMIIFLAKNSLYFGS
jgi:hypothetical protein